MARFDAVIESSKVGVRKPEPRFYEIACQTLGVEPPQCVFLDDLGINLKPAAAMGMHTIKVLSSTKPSTTSKPPSASPSATEAPRWAVRRQLWQSEAAEPPASAKVPDHSATSAVRGG